jgi:hypothetical protein
MRVRELAKSPTVSSRITSIGEHDARFVTRREPGDLLTRRTFAPGARQDETDSDRSDHHRCRDGDDPAPSARLRRRELSTTVLDLTEHVGGSGGVAVLEREVVEVVDVAGFVFALEIGERPQQESPFLLERGESVEFGAARRHRPPSS